MSFKHDPKKIDRVVSNRVQKLFAKHRDSILPIIQMGDPVLRTECKDYKGGLKEEDLRKLIFAMKQTMRKAPGVGLASTQVGLDFKIAVIEDTSVAEDYDWEEAEDEKETAHVPFFTIINPEYKPLPDPISGEVETTEFFEGCLSFDGYYAVRERFHRIEAKWTDEKGKDHCEEFSGWPARIFQHETDHLRGEVYIDKAQIRSLTTGDNMTEFDWDDNMVNAADKLGFDLKM